MSYGKLLQGNFVPRNPQKYKGNPSEIRFRSSWERKAMVFFDMNPSILFWSSEEHQIPYYSPVDGKPHRYFPDFLVKYKKRDGSIKVALIEIKPKSQTIPPVKKSKVTKRYITEVTTYLVNEAKWKAAAQWCSAQGYDFMILSESDLGINQ